jgi:exopolysaccharide biosynthesis predicted pyruvyltransferase EpsI
MHYSLRQMVGYAFIVSDRLCSVILCSIEHSETIFISASLKVNHLRSQCLQFPWTRWSTSSDHCIEDVAKLLSLGYVFVKGMQITKTIYC